MPCGTVHEVYQDMRSSALSYVRERSAGCKQGKIPLAIVQAAGKWDSMDIALCTSGHRIDSSLKDGCESLVRIKLEQILQQYTQF